MSYLKLQNGSDIRGIALEGIENQNINLTSKACYDIALGFAKWLSENKKKNNSQLKIAIGRDSRISGPAIRDAIISAFNESNINTYDFGLASTPAMFISTVLENYQYDAGIMITASHLPFNRNGLKFFTCDGGLDKKDITQILTYAQKFEGQEQQSFDTTCSTTIDFMSVYSNVLVEKVRSSVDSSCYNEPLKGFKIIVDAGNGAGGFFAQKVLVPLGADISGSQFLEPDGTFPNHAPNPEDPSAMESIKNAVLKNKADLGIIFDTDVDRAGAVDRNGKEINRNKLIALISAIALQEHPHTTIVTDSITSDGLSEFIQSLGGIHHRFKRGYKNVINEAIRLNSTGQDCQVAIETSGHGALKENYFLDDGAYLITKILITMAKLKQQNKEITSLISTLQEPLEQVELRFNITDPNFKDYGSKILQEFEEFAAANQLNIVKPNYEGIRISFPKQQGWLLFRMSLHDPLMPLNIESNIENGCKSIAAEFFGFIRQFDGIELKNIKEYLLNE